MTPLEAVEAFRARWREYEQTEEYREKMRAAQEIAVMVAEGEG
jgi:hypothetical protein